MNASRIFHVFNSSSSAPQQISPDDLTNKVLWLRDEVTLSGSDVSTWVDKYNSNDATNTVAIPAYSSNGGSNSRSKLSFVRANSDLLIGTNLALSDFTFFMVFKAGDISSNQFIFFECSPEGSTFQSVGFSLRINASTIGVQCRNSTDGVNEKIIPFTDTTSWHVLTVRFDSVGDGTSILNVRLDSAEKLSLTNMGPITVSGNNYRIGGTVGAYPSIDISEIIITSNYNDDNTVLGVERHLYNYYGLSSFVSTVTTDSSIDAVTSLYGRIAYNPQLANQPILILMAGWSQSATDIEDAAYLRFMGYGFFVVGVGMRGRDGASGSRDASARELYDIYDVLTYIRSEFSWNVSQSKASIVGYSGGGGNVVALSSKFPDTFSTYVTFFGITDYGNDATFGWYQQEPTRQADLVSSIGDTPTNIPNEYLSRKHLVSASNCAGKIYIFHDESDTQVEFNHSSRLKDELDADGFTNYVYDTTNSGDAVRWTHNLPNGSASIIQAETIFKNDCKNSITSIADSGTLTISGYLITSKFTIWLGNGTSAQDGKNRSATLVYNVSSNSYTLTPTLVGGATDMTVSITVLSGAHSGKTASGTISTETTFNPS
jgi:pimeloyl-ACP methyl ester carboxylesterase